jgi:dTDP-4-dehydrorhamnose reductase
MRWAVVGDKGMFGADQLALLEERGETATGFNRSNINLTRNSEQIAESLAGYDVVINATGYTQVDLAESQEAEATNLNGVIASKLGVAAALVGARFMHISTDYVFDGLNGRPYSVADSVNPQSAYGRSKVLGEQLVSQSGANFTILRTAWLYGQFGHCFPRAIAKAIEENGFARVVEDQFGQPTWTRDLAEQVLAYAVLDEAPKIVHVASSGQASWADFAFEIANTLGLDGREVVKRIATEDYPTLANRPPNSVLENTKGFVEPIGDWRERWLVAAAEVLGSR